MIFPYEFAAYGTGAIIQSDIRPMALVMHLDICKEHMYYRWGKVSPAYILIFYIKEEAFA